MSNNCYDIAIIGGSLAACISAALLAKQGSRVLFLRDHEVPTPGWFDSSLFLEGVLDKLGGRSCSCARLPFQILSRHARITVARDIPLDRELSRELGKHGTALSVWLEKLRHQGELLEKLLWQNGGLPWPVLKATTRFKLLCMRRKVNWSVLNAPVTKSTSQLPQPARMLVIDLLQGLALRHVDCLSQAEAALCWAQVLRPGNIMKPDFSALLDKRLDQFRGMQMPLEELAQIDFERNRWTGGRMADGSHFRAETFLLGDVRQAVRFGSAAAADAPTPATLTCYRTDSLAGQLSPLLGSRVICGGDLPLRLTIEQIEGQSSGLIMTVDSGNEQQLRQQLETALPFASYQLMAENGQGLPERSLSPSSRQRRLNDLPLRFGTNLYCADSCALLPTMGAGGAALLAWSLAENLAAGGEPRRR